MTYYQLPHEVGKKAATASGENVVNSGSTLQKQGDFPVGQALMASGIPVTLPLTGGDVPIVLFKEKPTEIGKDLLGNKKIQPTLSLFNITDDLAFREDVYVAEVQGLNEVGVDGVESAKWAQLKDVLVDYTPIPTGFITHDFKRQAVKLELAKSEGGFQRVRIATKKRFRYQTGRSLRSSVCLQMSLAPLVACEKTWGIGDSLDGYFFRIKGDGSGDNFMVVHRRSAGDGLATETVVPRSQFNHDKLDGTGGSGTTIDFTKNCMYLAEWGWYGASGVRFYAFVVDEGDDIPDSIKGIPRARWVLLHEMLIPDSLSTPSLGLPVLPFSIEITNNGYLTEPQFIIKYGLSLQIDGGETEKAEIHGADLSAGRNIGPALGGDEPAQAYPLMLLRAKDFAPGGLLNIEQGLPKTMTALANYATELLVIRDPIFKNSATTLGHFNGQLTDNFEGQFGFSEAVIAGPDGSGGVLALTTEEPEELNIAAQEEYDLTDMGTVEANFLSKQVATGKTLGTFFAPKNKPTEINLTKIYDLVRESITAEYDSQFDFPPANENIEILNIAADGTLTVERRHTFEPGSRFTLDNQNFFVIATPDQFTLQLSQTRNGVLYNNYAADNIAAPVFGTGFYDLVIDEAVAPKGRTISQGLVVIAARRVEDGLLQENFDEKNAEWMRAYNVTTNNTYTVVSPAPEVRAYLHYGLR